MEQVSIAFFHQRCSNCAKLEPFVTSLMSDSSTAAATRAVDDDDSDIANGDETIEVEVEEEEEEEVDNLSDSPNDVSEDPNDVTKEMESEEYKSLLESCSSSREKSKARLPSDSLAVEESRGNCGSSNGPLTRQKDVSHENHEESKYLKSGKHPTPAEDNGSEISQKDVGAFPPVKTHKKQNELHTDDKVHLCNSQIADFETTSPSGVAIINVAGELQMRGRLDEGTSEEEIKPMDIHSGDDKQRMESRFISPAIRTRSFSPGAEIMDGNKRPAVICNFFTKGWCIKGNSCRFLHVKNEMKNTTGLLEEDVAAASVNTDTQFDEGSRNMTKGSRMPCCPDPLACSVGNNLFSSDLSSERILTQEPGEGKRLPQFQENRRLSLLQRENTSLDISPSSQQLASSREDMGFILSSKDAGRESLRQNWPAADNGNCASLINKGTSPIFRNNLIPEYRSSSSGSKVLSSNYHSMNPSSYPSSLEERPWIQSKYMHNDYSSPVLSHPMNSSLGTSGPTSSSFPSHHISAWTGSSLPFYSSSSNASPLDAKKKSDSDRECRNSRLALFLRSTSPFPFSEPEKPLISPDNAKISSNDWEPSVPFQPSVFIAPTDISSPGSQYDPLRDSIDAHKIGHVPLKVSFSSIGVSTLNKSDQKLCGESMLSNMTVPGCNGDKSSVSSHGRFNENVLDKNCHTPRKDSHSDREEGVGTSIVDEQNGANCDSRIQDDGCRHNKELKVDRARQINEMDLEHKADGDVRKESKLTKHFRTVLVDFVKDLLKPTWREGRLTKDAHNTIVKKAVDKVLSTLQSHQIPTTMESIKQYLSSSQPKIVKLVEGYVDKYGKS